MDFETDLKKGKVSQARMFVEKKSIDSSVVDTWAERLPDICRSYEPRDRFNADKTGLLWKATPTQTLHFKGQKCSGGRTVKSALLFL